MAKRKLSRQQWRRIRGQQQQRGERAVAPEDTGEALRPDELGPETGGTVSCHHGQHIDVQYEQDGGLHTVRCHQRSNLPPLVTGDRVIWQAGGDDGGVVTALQPRKSVLTRPNSRGELRPVAANLDTVVIVVAPRPRPHANLIDRYLAAIENLALQPVLLLNKTDLLSGRGIEELLRRYTAIGYPVLRGSCKETNGTQALRQRLQGSTAVFVGQSGVGKSTLINHWLAAADTGESAAVGELSAGEDKGRHTTTATRLYRLPGGGALIDSPGIREFGLWHMEREELLRGFVEFRPYLGRCRFRDCRHEQEPGCALREAVKAGEVSERRLDSFFRIAAELKKPL